ncbi:hypothetical protein [Terriglobus aquaticus]|uniref:TM2 domain-containing protein n=1 Tax=Terriglobus aquaticus TaxID=940139 RepID=A0ABW9KK56_9BACT|nr:hypothetical protein [Terriglobus aquaticus]
MNGNYDSNFNEAGTPGAYTGNSGDSTSSSAPGYSAGQPAGSYHQEGNYTAPGSGYTSANQGADPYAAPGYVPPPPPGYAPPPPGYGAPGPIPVPPPPGSPNPGLAALLGFIPGVGAMYNGQFAKGVAHIIIFAVLTKIAEHLDIFGLFVAGWIFYMVFDAYQTARARRDGLVAPDPFGLNNIGERFGVPSNPNWGDFMARPAPGSASAADPARTSNPYAGPVVDPAAPAAAPVTDGPAYTAAPYAAAPGAYVPPATFPGVTMPPPWHPDYPEAVRRQATADATGAPVGYQATYAPYDPAAIPPMPPAAAASGIPVGAIWLIGLGIVALAGSLAHNFYWRGYIFGAASCFVFGTILLVTQTSVTRKLYQPGTAAYQWSLLHQARFGLTVLVVGVLQTIAGAGVTSWNYLWPYLLILFGLLQIADRALYNRMLLEPPAFRDGYGPVPAAAAPSASYSTRSESTSSASNEEEVR